MLLALATAAATAWSPHAAPARPGYAGGAVGRAAAAPAVMIIDQMRSAADAAKGAAAEAIVAKKVADKLERAKEKYDIPESYVGVMGGFFTSYMTEVYKSGKDMDEYEAILTELFTRVLERAKEPHQFEPFHRAMREPYDYYALGNNFAGGVIKYEQSKVVGLNYVDQIRAQVAAGDNVVLLANHQSEADPQVALTRTLTRTLTLAPYPHPHPHPRPHPHPHPRPHPHPHPHPGHAVQIFSCLLDEKYPGFAQETIFVAGDRVTTDMLAQV